MGFAPNKRLKNKVVLITGGSTGLGLILAEHLIKDEPKIAICARDEQDLFKAKNHLKALGCEVSTYVCDVAKKEQVDSMIKEVINNFGKLDIIINNAGIIQVGPMETFNHEDYKLAMDIMYWGIVNTTFSVLPHMKARHQGQIINITSIGGLVSVPHLLPYSAAKFAAVGFSEGSAAELRKDEIYVTTIFPWLMRTGSYVNAYFQKDNKKEFKLFSLISSLPILTINADRAAKKIIIAIKEKRPRRVIGIQAHAAIVVHNLFPNLTIRVFGLISRFIPGDWEQRPLEKGQDIIARDAEVEVPGARVFGQKARQAHQNLQ